MAPRKQDNSVRLNLRVKSALKSAINRLAVSENRSQNAQAAILLAEAVAARKAGS